MIIGKADASARIQLAESEDTMKTTMILNYMLQVAADFNRSVDKGSWTDTHTYYQKLKGIVTTLKILDYEITVWTEAPKPKYIIAIEIEKETWKIEMTEKGKDFYKCYKFQRFTNLCT